MLTVKLYTSLIKSLSSEHTLEEENLENWPLTSTYVTSMLPHWCLTLSPSHFSLSLLPSLPHPIHNIHTQTNKMFKAYSSEFSTDAKWLKPCRKTWTLWSHLWTEKEFLNFKVKVGCILWKQKVPGILQVRGFQHTSNMLFLTWNVLENLG